MRLAQLRAVYEARWSAALQQVRTVLTHRQQQQRHNNSSAPAEQQSSSVLNHMSVRFADVCQTIPMIGALVEVPLLPSSQNNKKNGEVGEGSTYHHHHQRNRRQQRRRRVALQKFGRRAPTRRRPSSPSLLQKQDIRLGVVVAERRRTLQVILLSKQKKQTQKDVASLASATSMSAIEGYVAQCVVSVARPICSLSLSSRRLLRCQPLLREEVEKMSSHLCD